MAERVWSLSEEVLPAKTIESLPYPIHVYGPDGTGAGQRAMLVSTIAPTRPS